MKPAGTPSSDHGASLASWGEAAVSDTMEGHGVKVKLLLYLGTMAFLVAVILKGARAQTKTLQLGVQFYAAETGRRKHAIGTWFPIRGWTSLQEML